MYLYKVVIKNSSIEGKGVFASEDIQKDAVVWKFDPQYDISLSPEDYERLDNQAKAEIRKVAYVSPTSGKWIYPPTDDPARFTNHSETANNLTAVFDPSISEEPFFIAKIGIKVGEELMVNYNEFDASIKQGKPEWMNGLS